MLNRQMLAAAWQIARLVLLVGAAILSWRLGLAAVDALWICSAAQAVACAGMLATMAICIQRRAVASLLAAQDRVARAGRRTGNSADRT